MSTKDQLLYSALHGTAMRYAAERRNLDESIEELRQIADGRNDLLAEAAGITAGSWYASPATHVGYELIGAGMLILAGGGRGLPLDYGELERWSRVGYERGMRARHGSGDYRVVGLPRRSAPGPIQHLAPAGDPFGLQQAAAARIITTNPVCGPSAAGSTKWPA